MNQNCRYGNKSYTGFLSLTLERSERTHKGYWMNAGDAEESIHSKTVKMILIILSGLMQRVNAPKGTQKSCYKLWARTCKPTEQTMVWLILL